LVREARFSCAHDQATDSGQAAWITFLINPNHSRQNGDKFHKFKGSQPSSFSLPDVKRIASSHFQAGQEFALGRMVRLEGEACGAAAFFVVAVPLDALEECEEVLFQGGHLRYHYLSL
jgi:hypothetical protein